MPSDRVNVSVVVPVRNESRNIRGCLESLEWADEVFVVDSGSTDGTRALAQSLGAHVVDFEYSGGWPKKKNWALRTLPFRNDWVLFIDADERVTPELSSQIRMAVQEDKVDGFFIRWKFIFLGRWLKHCWSHGWMLRLIRRGTGEFEDLGMRGEGNWDNEVHEALVCSGAVGSLSSPLIHDSREDLGRWIQKHNEYSTWEAARRDASSRSACPPVSWLTARDPAKRRKFLKAVLVRLPMRPLLVFLYLFFVRRGFLDGKPGFYFCACHAAHELFIGAKQFERTCASGARCDGGEGP